VNPVTVRARSYDVRYCSGEITSKVRLRLRNDEEHESGEFSLATRSTPYRRASNVAVLRVGPNINQGREPNPGGGCEIRRSITDQKDNRNSSDE